MLAVLHPMLVNLSFSVLSEGPYTTLFLSAVYVVVRALNHSSLRLWSLVGGAFGLAYLVRQEALAALLIAVLFALIATEGGQPSDANELRLRLECFWRWRYRKSSLFTDRRVRYG